MLTGIDQYHWERAGFFVRRGALGLEEVGACLAAADRLAEAAAHRAAETAIPLFSARSSEPALVDAFAGACVLGMLEDLLGPEIRYHRATLRVDPTVAAGAAAWCREGGRDVLTPDMEQVAALARRQGHAIAMVALRADEALCVVPGSHDAPLEPEQRAALVADECGDVPGQVRVRLQAGDAAYLSGSLLRRDFPPVGLRRRTLCCEVVSARQPEPVAAAEPWMSDEGFLDALPAPLRPLFERLLAAAR